MNKIELLAPAGNLEKLKTAVHYGADAVYLGGKEYGLRAYAGNFSLPEIEEGIEYAHRRLAKVYVTLNIFAHNEDLRGIEKYLEALARMRADGLIISDPGLLNIARRTVPEMNIHLSTQANTTNWAGARFWQQQGVKRIVLARELTLSEIREIREKVTVELEVFVHGAMCISYSGRCLLSNYLAGRDANKGECAQPCRWNYTLMEEKRPGTYYPLQEDDRGSYIFNSHDLCLLPHLPELIRTGVNSLKIEGRMKSVYYVATVVNAYRKALDEYYADPRGYEMNPRWYQELTKISHRSYTTGFLFGTPGTKDHNYGTSNYLRYYDFVGVVLEYDRQTGWATVEQRNNFQTGEELEYFGPRTDSFTQILSAMKNAEGEFIDTAPHPRQLVYLPVDRTLEPGDLIRRARVNGDER